MQIATHKAEEIFKILSIYEVNIEVLLKDERGKSEDIVERLFGEKEFMSPEQIADLFNNNSYLQSALIYLMETISLYLAKSNRAYKELSKIWDSLDVPLQETLENLDDIYRKVQEEESDAIDYLDKIARGRVATVHSNRASLDLIELIPNFINLKIVLDIYLRPSLEAILDKGYSYTNPFAGENSKSTPKDDLKYGQKETQDNEVNEPKTKKIKLSHNFGLSHNFFTSLRDPIMENENKNNKADEKRDKAEDESAGSLIKKNN